MNNKLIELIGLNVALYEKAMEEVSAIAYLHKAMNLALLITDYKLRKYHVASVAALIHEDFESDFSSENEIQVEK